MEDIKKPVKIGTKKLTDKQAYNLLLKIAGYRYCSMNHEYTYTGKDSTDRLVHTYKVYVADCEYHCGKTWNEALSLLQAQIMEVK